MHIIIIIPISNDLFISLEFYHTNLIFSVLIFAVDNLKRIVILVWVEYSLNAEKCNSS